MDRKNIYALAFVGAIILILYYLFRKPAGVTAPPSIDSFASPYTDWPNGIYPGTGNMNGSSQPFQPIDVTVNVPQFGQLSKDYIPTFGFVGVTAVGA